MRKRHDEALKEGSWQDRRAEVAHRPREHLVERLVLIEAEARGEALLDRAADLTAELGREGPRQFLGAGRQREKHGELSRRHRKFEIVGGPGPQLQEVRA